MPQSTQLKKGSMVAVNQSSGKKTTVFFQYNPSSLRRTLQPQVSGGETNSRSADMRFLAPPVEALSVQIELDASDQYPGFTTHDGQKVSEGATTIQKSGISPLIAVLEALVYPTSASIKGLASNLKRGVIEAVPPLAPLVLFSWGPDRLIPVMLQSLTITEEAFDANLNPVRATVALEMRVLNSNDVSPDSRAYGYFMTYLKKKEQLASLGQQWGYTG